MSAVNTLTASFSHSNPVKRSRPVNVTSNDTIPLDNMNWRRTHRHSLIAIVCLITGKNNFGSVLPHTCNEKAKSGPGYDMTHGDTT
ncbi:MAG: hypothetical protein OS112_04365 [Methanoregula sp.]|nr:MAG: hypothetical protein OS112_04365 [Methanoregula sp.]